MKFKILSLILILFLIPGSLVLTACKKDNNYSISNLDEDFYSVAENNPGNIVKVDNMIKFDFSKYNDNGKAFLNDIITTAAPYNELLAYNTLFENIISFPCEYVEICSKTEVNLSADVRNNIKSELDAFHKSVRDVGVCIDSLAEGLKISQDNLLNKICLERYKNLLLAYEKLYQTSSQFSNSVSTLYYKSVLVNSNPNVSEISLSDFDAGIVLNKLRGRLLYQKSNITQVYVEKYICGGDFAEEISMSQTTLDLTDYNKQINDITLIGTITEQQMAERANHENNKADFYDLAINAYSLQEILSNDASKFGYATKGIEYVAVKKDIDKATSNDIICKEIIDGYDFILNEYNNVLAEIIRIVVEQ